MVYHPNHRPAGRLFALLSPRIQHRCRSVFHPEYLISLLGRLSQAFPVPHPPQLLASIRSRDGWHAVPSDRDCPAVFLFLLEGSLSVRSDPLLQRHFVKTIYDFGNAALRGCEWSCTNIVRGPEQRSRGPESRGCSAGWLPNLPTDTADCSSPRGPCWADHEQADGRYHAVGSNRIDQLRSLPRNRNEAQPAMRLRWERASLPLRN